LAYLAKAYLPENVGRIVEVIKAYGANPEGHGFEWQVETRTKLRTVILDRGPANPALPAIYVVPDAWLRPISGVPVHDEVTDEVTA
jgi:hypothetical protein